MPPTWRRHRGVEPAFDQHPPPVLEQTDPAPDDPVWDSYLHDASDPPDPPDPPPDRSPDSAGRLRLVPDPDPAESADSETPTWRRGLDVEVQVVVSLATVLGLDDDPGLLRGYGALPADTIREIIDTAEATGATTKLRGLFCDPLDARLLTMESTAQLFTGGLRQFCTWRDQTDRLTGSRLSDLDHIHPRHREGRTTAANGQGLGILTNRVLKQHPHVTVHTLPTPQRGDGLDHHRTHAPDIEWTLPSGHTHTRTPPPVLGPGSNPTDHPTHDPAHDPAADPPTWSVLEDHLATTLQATA